MIGKMIAGKYRILDLKGTGGMAMVYRAEDMETGRIVAIKVLKPEHMQDEEIVRRFEMETQIASTYSHRNIVKTFETGQEEGMHYIIMEFIDGYTLQEYIHWKGRLDIEETLDIGRQICAALFYAHSHRLIHRDIKPQNILMDKKGGVKVADFGIAKAAMMESVTLGGDNALGSVHYISPEQARGNPVDEKTDIYSMGVVLYEMATGQVPFSGETPVSVALKQVQEEPLPPRQLRPELPKALEKIILKAMMKNPAARYDNAREMARDLEKVLLYPEGNYVVVKNVYDDGGTRILPKVSGTYELPKNNTPPPYTPPTAGVKDAQESSGMARSGRRLPSRSKTLHGPIIAISAVTGVLLLAISIFFVVQSLMDIPAKGYSTVVPSVVDLPLSVAESQLDAAGLLYDVEKVTDETHDADIVIAQTPEGTTAVPSGSKVKLTVSLGAQTVETPKLLDLTVDQAKEIAKEQGLTISEIRYESSAKAEGTIIKQDPLPGVRVDKTTPLVITVAQANTSVQPLMPDVTGLSKDEAIEKLSSSNISVTLIKKMDSAYAVDVVAKQEPNANTAVGADTQVILWVSTGNMSQYTQEYTLKVQIENQKTHVKVEFVDEDQVEVVCDSDYEPGENTLILNLQSNTPGDKTLIIYYDGVEVRRETVTMK